MRTLTPPSVRRIGLALVVALSGAGCDAELMSPEFERVTAERAAQDFVDRHREEWRVNVLGSDPPAILEQTSMCGPTGGSGVNVLLLSGRDARISLYLGCGVTRGASADELAAALRFVVIEALPHGIASPGWRFQVLTPSSSFSEGATLRVAGGRLTVDVDTPLFAIFGYSERPSCEAPQDGFATNECVLQRPFDVPLHLTFSVPYPRP
ncbi:MAG: hypothetical protein IT357_02830 [Gemmatimonadaceae bacterium]|nr:hypothetical protein [Gemmatimonadaceae bacterium]